MSNSPIEVCRSRWHRLLRGELAGGFDEVLHEDCAFLSPIVFTPQRGRDITALYLSAAAEVLGVADGSFRYVDELVGGNRAVLEFETEIGGRYANGVDIITCDDEGMITEFKVMLRPLQAINAVHAEMMAMLERLSEH